MNSTIVWSGRQEAAGEMVSQGNGGLIINASLQCKRTCRCSPTPLAVAQKGREDVDPDDGRRVSPHNITVGDTAHVAAATATNKETPEDGNLEREILPEIPLGHAAEVRKVGETCAYLPPTSPPAGPLTWPEISSS